MQIIVWGTGVRGKRAKMVCENMGYKLKAFIDNNSSRWGERIDNIQIISPEELTPQFVQDAQIWVATGAEEVNDQARKISNNVIEWNLLKIIILGSNLKYPYPSVELKKRNIFRCQLLENRIELLKCFSSDAKNWKMAEIGVFKGDFSEQILKLCDPDKLFLIDLWEQECKQYYLSVKERFENELKEDRVEILKGLSVDKLNEFEDGELDWVYVDTVHDYETTQNELELCHKKVREGGYICGHDYAKCNVYSRVDYGVYDAVNAFAVTYDYEFIYLTTEWHGLQSFCLKKI